jgi:hypothetical protein
MTGIGEGEGIRDAASAVAKLAKKTTNLAAIRGCRDLRLSGFERRKKAHTPSELGVCVEFA